MNGRATARLALGLAAFLGGPAAWGASEPAGRPAPTVVKPGGFVFNLLPKSFQSSPTMETSVFTEVTPFGRHVPPPSTAQPTYYFLHSGGYKLLGHSTPAGDKSPAPADLERVLVNSLARNGYRVTDAAHPATLLINYFWGSFAAMDHEDRQNFPRLAQQEYIQRALLVGGVKFAKDVDHTFTYGEGPREQIGKARDLRDQAADDLYYLVATAYGFTAQGRQQVWRTTMTVNSRGVSLAETLQPLVELAAPYFGRDLPEPELMTARFSRTGHVELGTPTVVPDKK